MSKANFVLTKATEVECSENLFASILTQHLLYSCSREVRLTYLLPKVNRNLALLFARAGTPVVGRDFGEECFDVVEAPIRKLRLRLEGRCTTVGLWRSMDRMVMLTMVKGLGEHSSSI